MAINNAVNAKVTGFQSLNATTGAWNGRTLTPGTGISITNQDGTGGDPVISATSSPPDSSFGTLVIVDDFIFGDGTQVAAIGETNWTGSGFVPKTGEANHPGITSNTTTGGTLIKTWDALSAAVGGILPGNGEITAEFIIRVVTTGAANLYIGIANKATGTNEPQNGCYFLYNSGVNSGNWVGKTANGGTRSSANSANAVVAGNWVRLKIVINSAASSVSFYHNGTEIANSPLATNIPTAALSLSVIASNGATVGIDVDLITLKYVLAVSR